MQTILPLSGGKTALFCAFYGLFTYPSSAVPQASSNRGMVNAALAGLVEGNTTASNPVRGWAYLRYSLPLVAPLQKNGLYAQAVHQGCQIIRFHIFDGSVRCPADGAGVDDIPHRQPAANDDGAFGIQILPCRGGAVGQGSHQRPEPILRVAVIKPLCPAFWAGKAA